MDEISKLRTDILDKLGGLPKKVILVEGETDETNYTHFLDKRYDNWENYLLLFPANGKENVLKELRKSPDFTGIVDKDEWVEEEREKQCREIANLIVLPRYCMDNYHVDPGEIWRSLPARNKKDISFEEFEGALLENHEDWLRYTALWHAVCPLYSRLRDAGFSDILLHEQNLDMIKEDAFILEKLNRWHDILDPQNTLNKYKQLFEKISTAGLQEQLHIWIHGKKFWEVHVYAKMVSFFGQKRRGIYSNLIWRNLPLPDDWEPIWKKLEKYQPELKIKESLTP